MSNRRMQFICRAFIVLFVVMYGSVLQAQGTHVGLKTYALRVISFYEQDGRLTVKTRRGKALFILPQRAAPIRRSYRRWFRGWNGDVHRFPFYEQLIVEIIRKYPPHAPSHRVLTPDLDEIEKLISQIILEITSDGSPEQLRRANRRLDRLVSQVIDVYRQDTIKIALRSIRWIPAMKESLPKPTQGPVQLFEVKFTSAPNGARIWLCRPWDYRLAEKRGTKAPWRLVTDPNRVILSGPYHYLLEWGDKSYVGEKVINIKKSGTYYLK